MKTSAIFRAAKPLISRKGDNAWRRYICYAIEDSGVPTKDIQRAREIITQRLGPNCNSLEVWLNKNGYIPAPLQMTNDQRLKMQVTRHAWLDSLIKEYKAKGD